MKYSIVNLILKTDLKLTASPTKVRGFLGNTYKDYPILHNHYANDKFLYSYPYVQYKIINGDIVIVGIDEGADLLKKIAPELTTLSLDKEYKITEKLIHEKEFDIKPSSEEKHYRFITPWLGLNQNNYQRYINSKDWKEKKDILNRVLVGNLLSMSKGLGIIVNKRLYAKTRFDEKIVEYKGVKMNAFTGEFKVHYSLPDYIGLGKGVSQGFGCVKEIIDEE
jgi:hypothetical protein